MNETSTPTPALRFARRELYVGAVLLTLGAITGAWWLTAVAAAVWYAAAHLQVAATERTKNTIRDEIAARQRVVDAKDEQIEIAERIEDAQWATLTRRNPLVWPRSSADLN